MAKAPTQTAKAPSASKKTVTVTYRPLEHGDGSYDPPVTKWNGITFHANMPVELNPRNRAHFIEQLLPKTFVSGDGDVKTKHLPQLVFMGDLAKDNPSFEVEGFPRARHIKPATKVPPAGAEWAGTNREELIPVGEIEYPEDFDPSAAGIVITSSKQAA